MNEELTRYWGSLNLRLRSGVRVKVELHKFKCDASGGDLLPRRMFREEDFWNHASHVLHGGETIFYQEI